MPICVHCSTPIKALYVAYGPSHIVCTRCKSCRQFADPYVEHESIIVAIDLILVKPSAYRHLLFNVTPTRPWIALARHFIALILIDSYIRWFYLCADAPVSAHAYYLVVRSTFLVQTTLHIVVMALTFLYHLALHDCSNRFRLVSNSLILSSLTPTFLLGLLLLWQPLDVHKGWRWNEASIDWAIRSLVNGLSAGVALGVVLPLQRTKLGASMATLVLLLGWYVQFRVSQLLQLPFHSGVGVLQSDAGRRGAMRYCSV